MNLLFLQVSNETFLIQFILHSYRSYCSRGLSIFVVVFWSLSHFSRFIIPTFPFLLYTLFGWISLSFLRILRSRSSQIFSGSVSFAYSAANSSSKNGRQRRIRLGNPVPVFPHCHGSLHRGWIEHSKYHRRYFRRQGTDNIEFTFVRRHCSTDHEISHFSDSRLLSSFNWCDRFSG